MFPSGTSAVVFPSGTRSLYGIVRKPQICASFHVGSHEVMLRSARDTFAVRSSQTTVNQACTCWVNGVGQVRRHPAACRAVPSLPFLVLMRVENWGFGVPSFSDMVYKSTNVAGTHLDQPFWCYGQGTREDDLLLHYQTSWCVWEMAMRLQLQPPHNTPPITMQLPWDPSSNEDPCCTVGSVSADRYLRWPRFMFSLVCNPFC